MCPFSFFLFLFDANVKAIFLKCCDISKLRLKRKVPEEKYMLMDLLCCYINIFFFSFFCYFSKTHANVVKPSQTQQTLLMTPVMQQYI